MNKTCTIVALAVFALIIGCSKNREDKIIGTWKSVSYPDDNGSTTYYADGTFVQKMTSPDGHDVEFKGTWTILNDGRIQHQSNGSSNTVAFGCSIDGDVMTRHFEFKRID